MDVAELLIREAVRDTIASYTAAGDRGDLEGLAACFAPDGALAVAGRDRLVGREAIVTGLVAMLDRPPKGGTADSRPAPSYLHHHVSSLHLVSVAPDEVRTVSYFSVLSAIGLDHWGRYRDRLVPVDGRWLFQLREVRTDGYAPGSRFEPA